MGMVGYKFSKKYVKQFSMSSEESRFGVFHDTGEDNGDSDAAMPFWRVGDTETPVIS